MRYFSFLIFIQFCLTLSAQKADIELGIVHWGRDLDKAKSIAQRTDKPILLFFQEVPGCQTCKNFGFEVMSDPLIAEYIETYFIPVLVYNNKGGVDAKILQSYGEPSWNNPVLRVIKSDGKDLIQRNSGKYDAGSIIAYLNSAVLASGRLVPGYALLLEEEYDARTSECVLEMYCFWSGEKNIGHLPGVISTTAGFSKGHEVVKVVYDPDKTNLQSLLKSASKSGNADKIYTSKAHELEIANKLKIPTYTGNFDFKKDKEVHYYLVKSKYAGIKMTEMQATKVNAAIGNGLDPKNYLSPKQLLCVDNRL